MDTDLDVALPPLPQEQPQAHTLNIHSLPNELLAEVFQHSIAGPLDATHTIRKPLVLASICSDWRRVAISTPQLWCRLHIKLATRRSQDDFGLVSTWLGRSGACPLQFSVQWFEKAPKHDHPALNALASRSQQWRKMLLHLPLLTLGKLSKISRPLPFLQELNITTLDAFDGTTDTFEEPIIAFRDAMNLRRLECIRLPFHLLELPWTQMEEIPALHIPVDQCSAVLRQSPNLLTAVFAFDYHTSTLPDDAPTFEHSQLKSLTFYPLPWREVVNPESILRYLQAPKLIHLKISKLSSPIGTDLLYFVQYTPKLTSLSLNQLNLTDKELIPILEMLPNLEQLFLGPCRFVVSDYTIERLRFRSQAEAMSGSGARQHPSNICPRLQSISVHLSAKLASDFIRAVSSRAQPSLGCAKLLEVEMHLSSEAAFPRDVQDLLVSLREGGMVLRIHADEDDD
ncbi:hypothetical protein AX16_003784 [Volvariella volvacea WC 439]|nr:hypothetical protein AX16_003784 [Volvariella volvacea WC 439]